MAVIVFHPTINANILRKAFRKLFVSCYLNIVVIVRECLDQNHLLVYNKIYNPVPKIQESNI